MRISLLPGFRSRFPVPERNTHPTKPARPQALNLGETCARMFSRPNFGCPSVPCGATLPAAELPTFVCTSRVSPPGLGSAGISRLEARTKQGWRTSRMELWRPRSCALRTAWPALACVDLSSRPRARQPRPLLRHALLLPVRFTGPRPVRAASRRRHEPTLHLLRSNGSAARLSGSRGGPMSTGRSSCSRGRGKRAIARRLLTAPVRW